MTLAPCHHPAESLNVSWRCILPADASCCSCERCMAGGCQSSTRSSAGTPTVPPAQAELVWLRAQEHQGSSGSPLGCQHLRTSTKLLTTCTKASSSWWQRALPPQPRNMLSDGWGLLFCAAVHAGSADTDAVHASEQWCTALPVLRLPPYEPILHWLYIGLVSQTS